MVHRRGGPDDAPAIAEVYLRSRHAAVPAIPPLAHSDDEVRAWLAGVVLAEREVWVAEAGACGQIVGLMVLNGPWIDQLYLDPAWTGRGIGGRLLDLAKRLRPAGLQLWTFQSNRRARRFYERHGFRAVEKTDGAGNEERAPDVRYIWPSGEPE